MKNYKVATSFRLLLIILLMTTLLAVPAYAHRVVTYAYVSGESIVVETAFGNGSPFGGAMVKVYGSEGELLKKGKTNKKGIYKFKIPQKSDLKIVVGGELGHQGKYTIKEEELPSVSNQNSRKNELSIDKNSSMAESDIDTDKINQTEDKIRQSSKDKLIAQEEVRSILKEELSKQIAPLNRKITQLQIKKGPGMTEVIGGIGYIFGLMGIAFYFKSKGE
ncbi:MULTISPECIES: hypothetical protein [unclassified Candidatus Frackibacter]|uniref:hypothetical protein n=1 Tax=unclassified Candidatus Frackibacter TaxID=2648818 RepID=UPI0007929040|nr:MULTISPECIES: hypothetical protein [unclassified Candidatus Frackibacter]KXS37479.1 MAG: hypothetical protein AWU54_2299 [Candidatus Frackibacter sp. T328-2]SDC34494.1 nickel transport protein [Candidatus Frackibacter sp. WG11]SEM56797.1 nickel transport protein [Candidatus Frackibacter sp. WG12]SFL70492.1 nickel transport protein [Candidatus Frackibacter sp. WG13]